MKNNGHLEVTLKDKCFCKSSCCTIEVPTSLLGGLEAVGTVACEKGLVILRYPSGCKRRFLVLVFATWDRSTKKSPAFIRHLLRTTLGQFLFSTSTDNAEIVGGEGRWVVRA